jgi:uncharacterized protein YdaU (DUF1376 family)
LNYYPHHIGDYAKDTGHLSWDEDMAYTRLLRAYYSREGAIPEDQAYRLARASSTVQRKAVDSVLKEFFALEGDGWHNKRADAELAIAKEKSDKARTSAAKRWQSNGSNANAMRTHSEGNAPNNQEPITKNQKKKQSPSRFALPEWVPVEAWQGYIETRKKKRAPNTDHALDLAVRELEKLRVAGHDPKAVLEQSVFRGWQGLFPIGSNSGTVPDYSAVFAKYAEEGNA